MGKLRKIGKKLKKGVKKLFSSKIGAFLGSMALSMILGPVIGRAFNGLKGAVMGTGATATQAAATAATQTTAAAAQTAAAEAGKKALVEKGLDQAISKSLLAESGKKLTTEQLLAGETLQSVASKEVAGKALSKEALKSSFGTSLSKGISTTGLNPKDLTSFLTEKVATGTMPINMSNSVTGSLNNFNDFLETGDMFKPDLSVNTALTESMPVNKAVADAKTATDAAKAATKAAKETKFFGDGNLKSDIKGNFKDVGTDIKEFGKDPVGKTKEIVGENFVGDTVKAVGSSYLSEMMNEPPEDLGGYGRVISSPALVAAQGNYMQSVASNYQAAFNTRVKSFDEIMQQAMYGTTTPQFMTPYRPFTGK